LILLIGGSKQHAAQPEKIARNLKLHNLAPTTGQHLVRTGPAFGQNKGRLVLLPYMDQS
jgi:hypothetical protein